MNLIEQLGDYEKAKEWYDENTDKEWVGIYHIPKLYLALLEYRRENNIFEHGDKIVFHKGKKYIWDFYTKSDIKPYDIAVCNSKFIKYTYAKNIRHATDEEIKAGHRL